jgi:integrase
MAVYRPTYPVIDKITDKPVIDPVTGTPVLKHSKTWWYHFSFAGRRIQESSKSEKKTLALMAEKRRRAELERGFNAIEDSRVERVKSIAEVADEFLSDYKVRNPRSANFAEWSLKHVKRLLGTRMVIDVSDVMVRDYQTARLKEQAAPKTINEEVLFLLRILGEQGDFIRARLRRQKALKLKGGVEVAKAYSEVEKAALIGEAKKRRSPAILPALMLALHAGLRDSEILGLQWERVFLDKRFLIVGESKSEAGEGRTIPLNTDLHRALVDHARWYLRRFRETRPEWYLFPFGKPQPTDPTRPMVTLKTVWARIRKDAGIEGRWHDCRHTFITNLAESGEAGDETIRAIAGHVSARMLKHYSHIGMEAKRRAVKSLTVTQEEPQEAGILVAAAKVSAKVLHLN